MINSEDAKEVVVKVLDTEPHNRSWVLSLILNVILAIACFFCYSRMINAENREIKAKTELDVQKALNLTDSKDCLKLIREAEKAKDLEWSTKFDNLQNTSNKDLRLQADKLEKEINRIRKKLGQ
jgi:hypothetical protein